MCNPGLRLLEPFQQAMPPNAKENEIVCQESRLFSLWFSIPSRRAHLPGQPIP